MPALKSDETFKVTCRVHCPCGVGRNKFRRKTEPRWSNKLNEALLNLFASTEQKRRASGCLLVNFSLRAPFLHPGVYSLLTAWLDFRFKYLISDCLLWHQRQSQSPQSIFVVLFATKKEKQKNNSVALFKILESSLSYLITVGVVFFLFRYLTAWPAASQTTRTEENVVTLLLIRGDICFVLTAAGGKHRAVP